MFSLNWKWIGLIWQTIWRGLSRMRRTAAKNVHEHCAFVIFTVSNTFAIWYFVAFAFNHYLPFRRVREITWRCYPKSECTHLETSRDEWEREWVSQRGRARRRKTENKCLAFVSCIFRYHNIGKTGNWALQYSLRLCWLCRRRHRIMSIEILLEWKLWMDLKVVERNEKWIEKSPTGTTNESVEYASKCVHFILKSIFVLNYSLIFHFASTVSFRPFDPTTHTIRTFIQIHSQNLTVSVSRCNSWNGRRHNQFAKKIQIHSGAITWRHQVNVKQSMSEWVCGMRQTKMLKSMTMMRMVMPKNGIDAWYCDLKQHKTLTTHRRLLLPTKGFHINHRGRAMCQICLCIYEKVSKIGSGTHNLCVVEAINSKASPL